MPAFDNEWVFSSAQSPIGLPITSGSSGISQNVHSLALDAANATATSTVDLIAGIMPPRLYAVVTTAANAGAGTINFQLISATDAALTANVVVHFSNIPATGTPLSFSSYAAGFEIAAVNLDPQQTWHQFVGIRVVVGGGVTLTAFAFTAALVDSIQSAKVKYANRFNFATP